MEKPDEDELRLIKALVYTSTLNEEEKEDSLSCIDKIGSYEDYLVMQWFLEEIQPSIDQIPSPRQRDINKHIKKLA